MPKGKAGKILCVDNLRHAEYYDMQAVKGVRTSPIS